MIVNYARHRSTLHCVFLRSGELPAQEMFGLDWAWYRPPERGARGEQVMLIGEGPGDRCARLRHAPRACDDCKRIALIEDVRRGRLS